ncbi:tRNA A64-2'-O-ribosylphosphate transferase [Elasticomyces elasticus]|uniref:tRNA A64-2'-O-ribosylphosphate transferase n=1 Tax=Elasticomyces elasticus TaxID=574655 RepID=A0AAN7VVI8_9PEZI|nr:tRNA A64-2'-O-ribosylphosphate transferase [Elasticomyces elasticus]
MPLLESDLIFSLAASDLKNALGELKKSNLSITNRLRSIKQDADFVLSVSEAYNLPLIANERCGSWYIPSDRKTGSAYFKSTDGHFGQWSFSLRRLNLQVLSIVEQHGGCIIVDSTRRGKSMPDALSKTVPIWIAVLNRLLFPEHTESHALRTPAEVVSLSEHSQIESRLPLFLEGLGDLNVDLNGLRSTLTKPMRPVWVTPGGTLDASSLGESHGVCPIILVTSSNRESAGSHNVSKYVQGAADDHESWALGLDPAMFWANMQQMLNTPESELPSLISKLVVGAQAASRMRSPTLVRPSTTIWIADNEAAENLYRDFDTIVHCSAAPSANLASKLKIRHVHLACSSGKNGSRQLRKELEKLAILRDMLSPMSKVLVTCETGRDLAVGAALAILCSLYSNDGTLHDQSTVAMSKSLIKQRLSWIMVSMPDASPSRATLQSVNAHLMS